MPESSAVDFRVHLPQRLADDVERVRDGDPEALTRIVAYGVTRRLIFDHLVARGAIEGSGTDLSY